jgi:hypothetical protein
MMPTDYQPYYGIILNLPWLADDLADELSSEDLIQFILKMDLRKADMDFTTKLYAAIGDALRKGLDVDHDGTQEA